MLLLQQQQQQQQHAKRQARERVRENRFRFKFLAVRIRFSIKNLSARPMNVYPIFLSLYVIMTMRTRVGRIAYRVSDKPRKVPPLPRRRLVMGTFVLPINAKLAVIRELPVRVAPRRRADSLSDRLRN